TVQAPHCAMPQPNLVPVIPRMSRSTHSSGMSGGASKDFVSPLMVRTVAICIPLLDDRLRRSSRRNFRATIIITTRTDEASKFLAMHICATEASGHDVHEFVRRSLQRFWAN